MTATTSHSSQDPRIALETKLHALHSVLSRIEELSAQRTAIYDQHQHRFHDHLPEWSRKKYRRWVFLIAVTTVEAVALLYPWLGGDTLIAGLVLPIPLGLAGARALRGKKNAQIAAKNAQIDQQNEEIAEQIGQETWPLVGPISANIDSARKEFHAQFRGFFPEKYLTPTDVAACWHIVHDHRAATVGDAINVLEGDLHHRYLENVAEAQLAEQQRANKIAVTSSILNAIGQGAIIGTMRSEGAATRAAMSRPVEVNVRRR
ncbi:MAG: hypothetical protein ACTJGT_03940 [Microbacteriaceae bacterium]